MRVLIIEDDPKTASYLSKGLRENGFVPDIAQDGQEGLFLVNTQEYDLIILDVMLPKLDGWSVIAAIRTHKRNLPILFLTARDAVEDRVKGFELGADDYLVKPFAFSELLARVRSLLRRGQTRQTEVLELADLKIDLLGHKAFRGGKRLDLTAKEFILLTLLVKHAGEFMSRTFITEQVWDINFDSDTNIVDATIRRLRRKVDDPFEKKLIHTVRGMGYVVEER